MQSVNVMPNWSGLSSRRNGGQGMPIIPPRTSLIIALAAGWLFLFAPVYASFTQNVWTRPENGHAPFLLAFVSIVLVRKIWHAPASSFGPVPRIIPLPILVAGGVYFLGRAGEVQFLESLAQPLFLVVAILLMGGARLLRALWFPVAMSAYLIIFPGWLVDAATGPVKFWISGVATDILYAAGVPVARSGVLIAIGPYQLFVADACAGLNSLISLTSIAAVYLYITGTRSVAHGAVLFFSAIPIAILANLFRVIILILITWHGGYDMAQFYLHELAGLVLFGLSLALVFLVDNVLRWTVQRPHRARREVTA